MQLSQPQGMIAARRRQGVTFRRFTGQMAVSAALVIFTGASCQAPPPATPKPGTILPHEEIDKMPLEKDISGVAAVYDPYSPWLWNDEHSKVRGVFVTSLYLFGPQSVGVFGDGVIKARVYLLEGTEGRWTPTKMLREWSFDPNEALQWRSRKRTPMGWRYALALPWGDDIDVRGKQIRVTLSFERVDGRTIHAREKDFRVP